MQRSVIYSAECYIQTRMIHAMDACLTILYVSYDNIVFRFLRLINACWSVALLVVSKNEKC